MAADALRLISVEDRQPRSKALAQDTMNLQQLQDSVAEDGVVISTGVSTVRGETLAEALARQHVTEELQ